MREAQLRYLKLDMNLARELGLDCAALFACLKFLAKRQKLDDHGFFQVDRAFLQPNLGLSRNRLLRARKELENKGLIQVIDGLNQNQKPRYKIVVR
ncbi:hypothetical protein IJ117_00610 [Candidatus Saccharibacteria bacterium]|nr:hypothetical protein [Candidatus Saccharibacteria bacterium]